jgi:hypothetical protein
VPQNRVLLSSRQELPLLRTYRIEVDRINPDKSVTNLVEYRKMPKPKTIKGSDRQLNNMVNRIADELRYYKVEFERYTVSVVPSF